MHDTEQPYTYTSPVYTNKNCIQKAYTAVYHMKIVIYAGPFYFSPFILDVQR